MSESGMKCVNCESLFTDETWNRYCEWCQPLSDVDRAVSDVDSSNAQRFASASALALGILFKRLKPEVK